MDFRLLGVTLVLTVLGIMSIYSSGVTSDGILVSDEYLRQTVWAVSGLVILGVLLATDYKRYKDFSFLIYGAFIVLLVYTRLGGRVVNGARSWIGFGGLGIQPSEFSKLATILCLAQYLAATETTTAFRRLVVSCCITAVPVVLILAQPDFGTSLVFFPILIFMIFAAHLDMRYILFIVLMLLFTFILLVLPLWERLTGDSPLPMLFIFHKPPYVYLIMGLGCVFTLLSSWGWYQFRNRYYFWISYVSLLVVAAMAVAAAGRAVLKEYQVMRLMVFLDPQIDPRGSGWNILQAMTAIGSGGLTGKGFLQGTQSHYNFIPQQSTDFIFSIIAEEWGFVGGILVFFLFYLILRSCTNLLATVKDRYAAYVVAGIFGMIFFHFMINAGMVMGIMPITGIPLYFLSYGGSSLWSVMASIGILLGISARRYRM